MEPLTAFYRMAGDVPAIRRGCGKYCQQTQELKMEIPVHRVPWMRLHE